MVPHPCTIGSHRSRPPRVAVCRRRAPVLHDALFLSRSGWPISEFLRHEVRFPEKFSLKIHPIFPEFFRNSAHISFRDMTVTSTRPISYLTWLVERSHQITPPMHHHRRHPRLGLRRPPRRFLCSCSSHDAPAQWKSPLGPTPGDSRLPSSVLWKLSLRPAG